MRPAEANLTIRPRSAWEALDLGTLLARRHAGVLMFAWAALTLPVFGLLSALCWQQPSLALLLFWWLKPLYERLPLHILSQAVFGQTPGVRQSLRALPGVLRPQWLASLTWRRFSSTRSFDLPVLQLEGLAGAARQRRLTVLGQRERSVARWLTVVGMHLEGALWLGLLALLYFFLPAQLAYDSWSWEDLLRANDDWLWLEHLSNLLYVLVLIVWEPIYVACGFSLYLNRRTRLEAWDLELAFRRLRAHLLTALPALLLGLCLLSPNTPVWAASDGAAAPATAPAPLSRDEARQRVRDLLDQPPFTQREAVTRWRFAESPADAEPGVLARLLENLLRLDSFWHGRERLTLLIETLLWSALALLVALLLWHRRDWLQAFGRRLPRRDRRHQPPAQLFGLAVTPESLPDDVASAAERLWPTQPRQALGLLYRAMLSRLLHDHRLPLVAGHTEGEVLEAVRTLAQPELTTFAATLTRHWQGLAYGRQTPDDAAWVTLCAAWRRLFEPESRP
ncbi:MAG: DUF4129 domain-containing protein [Pseudomonadaceae bacterium]|jgi:hypothetical protein|nr:DUF4129 domain-containing protein [Pseudomonadaceae bacterium]